ncbi:Regulator of nucleoside diphosphate kinase [Rubripirellula obstinata]|uniref:Regulator of nucleoside diphosphate kinase n=1 Tax=Rubripirellula obstinata TaxID=406547 RepID=A0A5B1CRI1_9BACT|nr:GreA/GreB family elongation factor [Rubripirellula obstinata]KAA1261993.1 Regulator of nucleoside diphosphate kinase [Rubripirellula obstinata]
MPTRKPLITQSDYQQIRELLESDYLDCIADSQTLSMLQHRIESALIVDDDRVPASVVTMESVVQLRDPINGDEDVYTLVFPEHADIAVGKLSVISPIGIAILGRHVGQMVRGRVPSGQRTVQIQSILFQPEHDDVAPQPSCRVPSTQPPARRQSLFS